MCFLIEPPLLMAANMLNTSHASLFDSEEEELDAQLQAWHLTLAFASSMAVKAACLLRIPDILATHGPLALSQIASVISSSSPAALHHHSHENLRRILRFLCSQNFFSLTTLDDDENSEPKYALTAVSKLLVSACSSSFAPMTLMLTNSAAMAPWHHLSDCVLIDELPFERAHGMNIWSFSNKHPDFSKLFNDAMACSTNLDVNALLKHYHGFADISTLVDVGGGVGMATARIAARYPSIRAINFDLPHVVATAPSYPGVKHIGGNMFEDIPSTDAILLKSILHDWDDERCNQILKNCRKAICETGKVIIVEAIVETEKEGSDPFNQVRLAMDLLMMANATKGKERTKAQWEALLTGAGFPRYNFVHLPAIQIVIETFPT